MAYGYSRYSRTNTRRRRRRRRIILAVLASVLVVSGIGVAVAVFGLPSVSVSGGNSSSLSSDRFEGIGTVSIPDGAQEEMWWTAVSTETVDAIPGVFSNEGSQFSRTRIPADLLFGADSAALTPEAKASLRTIAERLALVDAQIYVVCHSSSDGPVQQRRSISVKRANALASELETLMKDPANSIRRVGLGDKFPLPNVDPNSSSGKVLNRRCDIYVEN